MLLDEKGGEFLGEQTRHVLPLGERREFSAVKHPLVRRLRPFQPPLLSIAIHGTLLENLSARPNAIQKRPTQERECTRVWLERLENCVVGLRRETTVNRVPAKRTSAHRWLEG